MMWGDSCRQQILHVQDIYIIVVLSRIIERVNFNDFLNISGF
jgi:hypothetical protein